ncbi:hypothetical protein F5Y10DRAFT_244815 [Nemania abortiva]|nr:hypothetical protein F5Y10DRAFT_244815 [Nemania abortiva]
MPFEHNVPSRYLKREKLEELLGELFPDHVPIKIVTSGDDQYVFTAPAMVTDKNHRPKSTPFGKGDRHMATDMVGPPPGTLSRHSPLGV